MTARTAGFVSRAGAGLIPPRSVSYDIRPGEGGLAVHYGGPIFRVSSHAQCASVWRGYQQWHMRPGGLGVPQGGNDIAYNFGVCPHGYIFAGRGLGVRSGANGTYNANTTHYAVCWMNDRSIPNVEVLDAVEWIILNVRQHGAGTRVVGHRVLFGTECPGDPMAERIKRYDRQPLGPAPKPPKSPNAPMPPPGPLRIPKFPLKAGQFYGRGGVIRGGGLSIYQGRLKARGWKITVDGKWGPQSESITRAFQSEKGLVSDGKAGLKTWNTAWAARIT